MKKIALFSLMCCLCGVYAVPAFATCGASTLGFDGNQDPDDDEFLYQNKQQFDLTKAGYENTNHQNSGTGIGIECDTTKSAGCDSGQVIELLPGHVFKGTVVKEKRKYQCTSRLWGDDMWEVVGGFCETRWGTIQVGQSLTDKKTTTDCSGLNKTENNTDAIKLWQVICRDGGIVRCKPTDCNAGYKLDRKNGKCIKDCSGDKCKENCPTGQTRATKDIIVTKVCSGDKCVAIEKGQCYDTDFLKCMEAADRGEPANWNGKSCNCGDRMVWDNKNYRCKAKSGGGNVAPQKSCKDLRKTPTGKACCDLPKTQAEYNEETDTCNCLDKNAEFRIEIENGKGMCVAKEPVPEQNCTYYFSGTIECGDRTVEISETKSVTVPCVEGVVENLTEEMFENDTGKLRQIREKLCAGVDGNGSTPGTTVVSTATVDYRSAEAILDKFVSNAESERSVWKNAEGKFNTTLLASDITAGVVLGTVGGVVTGVVIKKNQVKKGFEALHCAVGGQKVAEWGDEFSVGLRR